MNLVSFNKIPINTALIIAAPAVIGITIGLIAKKRFDARQENSESKKELKELSKQITLNRREADALLIQHDLKRVAVETEENDNAKSEKEPAPRSYFGGKSAFLLCTIGGLFASSISYFIKKGNLI